MQNCENRWIVIKLKATCLFCVNVNGIGLRFGGKNFKMSPTEWPWLENMCIVLIVVWETSKMPRRMPRQYLIPLGLVHYGDRQVYLMLLFIERCTNTGYASLVACQAQHSPSPLQHDSWILLKHDVIHEADWIALIGQCRLHIQILNIYFCEIRICTGIFNTNSTQISFVSAVP